MTRLITLLEQRKEIYMEVDGYFVYAPSESYGFLTAHQLRHIADYLDELNRFWNKQIEQFANDDRTTS